MPGDHVLRYIIELEPADQASEYEKMHLIYENKEYNELRRGIMGECGRRSSAKALGGMALRQGLS